MKLNQKVNKSAAATSPFSKSWALLTIFGLSLAWTQAYAEKDAPCSSETSVKEKCESKDAACDADKSACESKECSAGNKPQKIGLIFHADWCGSCKAMEPEIVKAMGELKDQPVLFVTFDLTNDQTTRQAEMLASALGVDEIFAEKGGKTGFMLVYDVNGEKVTDTVTRNENAEQIVSFMTL